MPLVFQLLTWIEGDIYARVRVLEVSRRSWTIVGPLMNFRI
jgi:hypothetical protein